MGSKPSGLKDDPKSPKQQNGPATPTSPPVVSSPRPVLSSSPPVIMQIESWNQEEQEVNEEAPPEEAASIPSSIPASHRTLSLVMEEPASFEEAVDEEANTYPPMIITITPVPADDVAASLAIGPNAHLFVGTDPSSPPATTRPDSPEQPSPTGEDFPVDENESPGPATAQGSRRESPTPDQNVTTNIEANAPTSSSSSASASALASPSSNAIAPPVTDVPSVTIQDADPDESASDHDDEQQPSLTINVHPAEDEAREEASSSSSAAESSSSDESDENPDEDEPQNDSPTSPLPAPSIPHSSALTTSPRPATASSHQPNPPPGFNSPRSVGSGRRPWSATVTSPRTYQSLPYQQHPHQPQQQYPQQPHMQHHPARGGSMGSDQRSHHFRPASSSFHWPHTDANSSILTDYDDEFDADSHVSSEYLVSRQASDVRLQEEDEEGIQSSSYHPYSMPSNGAHPPPASLFHTRRPTSSPRSARLRSPHRPVSYNNPRPHTARPSSHRSHNSRAARVYSTYNNSVSSTYSLPQHQLSHHLPISGASSSARAPMNTINTMADLTQTYGRNGSTRTNHHVPSPNSAPIHYPPPHRRRPASRSRPTTATGFSSTAASLDATGHHSFHQESPDSHSHPTRPPTGRPASPPLPPVALTDWLGLIHDLSAGGDTARLALESVNLAESLLKTAKSLARTARVSALLEKTRPQRARREEEERARQEAHARELQEEKRRLQAERAGLVEEAARARRAAKKAEMKKIERLLQQEEAAKAAKLQAKEELAKKQKEIRLKGVERRRKSQVRESTSPDRSRSPMKRKVEQEAKEEIEPKSVKKKKGKSKNKKKSTLMKQRMDKVDQAISELFESDSSHDSDLDTIENHYSMNHTHDTFITELDEEESKQQPPHQRHHHHHKTDQPHQEWRQSIEPQQPIVATEPLEPISSDLPAPPGQPPIPLVLLASPRKSIKTTPRSLSKSASLPHDLTAVVPPPRPITTNAPSVVKEPTIELKTIDEVAPSLPLKVVDINDQVPVLTSVDAAVDKVVVSVAEPIVSDKEDLKLEESMGDLMMDLHDLDSPELLESVDSTIPVASPSIVPPAVVVATPPPVPSSSMQAATVPSSELVTEPTPQNTQPTPSASSLLASEPPPIEALARAPSLSQQPQQVIPTLQTGQPPSFQPMPPSTPQQPLQPGTHSRGASNTSMAHPAAYIMAHPHGVTPIIMTTSQSTHPHQPSPPVAGSGSSSRPSSAVRMPSRFDVVVVSQPGPVKQPGSNSGSRPSSALRQAAPYAAETQQPQLNGHGQGQRWSLGNMNTNLITNINNAIMPELVASETKEADEIVPVKRTSSIKSSPPAAIVQSPPPTATKPIGSSVATPPLFSPKPVVKKKPVPPPPSAATIGQSPAPPSSKPIVSPPPPPSSGSGPTPAPTSTKPTKAAAASPLPPKTLGSKKSSGAGASAVAPSGSSTAVSRKQSLITALANAEAAIIVGGGGQLPPASTGTTSATPTAIVEPKTTVPETKEESKPPPPEVASKSEIEVKSDVAPPATTTSPEFVVPKQLAVYISQSTSSDIHVLPPHDSSTNPLNNDSSRATSIVQSDLHPDSIREHSSMIVSSEPSSNEDAGDPTQRIAQHRSFVESTPKELHQSQQTASASTLRAQVDQQSDDELISSTAPVSPASGPVANKEDHLPSIQEPSPSDQLPSALTQKLPNATATTAPTTAPVVTTNVTTTVSATAAVPTASTITISQPLSETVVSPPAPQVPISTPSTAPIQGSTTIATPASQTAAVVTSTKATGVTSTSEPKPVTDVSTSPPKTAAVNVSSTSPVKVPIDTQPIVSTTVAAPTASEHVSLSADASAIVASTPSQVSNSTTAPKPSPVLAVLEPSDDLLDDLELPDLDDD